MSSALIEKSFEVANEFLKIKNRLRFSLIAMRNDVREVLPDGFAVRITVELVDDEGLGTEHNLITKAGDAEYETLG